MSEQEQVEELAVVDTEVSEDDHPDDELTEDEAARADELYRRIDDLDDESNGLDQ